MPNPNPYLHDVPVEWNEYATPRDMLYFRSREHQQLQHEAVAKHLPPLEGLRVVDFGCGYGDFLDFVPADCKYVGLDVNPHVIARARIEHDDREFRVTNRVPKADIIVAVAVVQCGLADPKRLIAKFHAQARLLTVFTCTYVCLNSGAAVEWCPGPAEVHESSDDFFTVVMRP